MQRLQSNFHKQWCLLPDFPHVDQGYAWSTEDHTVFWVSNSNLSPSFDFSQRVRHCWCKNIEHQFVSCLNISSIHQPQCLFWCSSKSIVISFMKLLFTKSIVTLRLKVADTPKLLPKFFTLKLTAGLQLKMDAEGKRSEIRNWGARRAYVFSGALTCFSGGREACEPSSLPLVPRKVPFAAPWKHRIWRSSLMLRWWPRL